MMRKSMSVLTIGLSSLVALIAIGCSSPPEPAAKTAAKKTPAPATSAVLVPVTTKDAEARSLFEAGRVKADRLRQKEAAEDFRAAVEKDPNFAMAWLALAGVSRTNREYDEAEARAVAAKDRVTEDERLMIDAAVAERDGRIAEAQKLRQEVCRRYPADARARYQLGLAFWRSQDEKAVENMEKAVELYPGLDAAWNMLGYVYSSLGRNDDAVRAHLRYVDLLPNEPNAHDSLAETYMKAGKFEESIVQYRTALELEPEFHWSRLGIGHNQVFLGRYLEAAQTYQQALSEATALFPKYQAAEWMVVLGVYADDPDAALRATDRAIEIATRRGEVEGAWAVRLKARILLFAEKADEAEALAAEALRKLPDNASDTARDEFEQSILRLRVEIRIVKGDLPAAQTVLAELRAKVAASSSAWQEQMLAFIEGYLLLAEGEAAEAEAAFEKASPTDPRVLFHLAEAKSALGKSDEARAIYDRIVSWNAPGLGHALVIERAKARLAK